MPTLFANSSLLHNIYDDSWHNFWKGLYWLVHGHANTKLINVNENGLNTHPQNSPPQCYAQSTALGGALPLGHDAGRHMCYFVLHIQHQQAGGRLFPNTIHTDFTEDSFNTHGVRLNTVSRNSKVVCLSSTVPALSTGTAKCAAHMSTANNIENSHSSLTSSPPVSVNERQRVTHMQ